MTLTKETFAEWMQIVLALRYVNVDYNPYNKGFGAQCWDLFAHFCTWFGLAVINTYGGRWSGWAGALVDQYWANGASLEFDLIDPSEPAQQGDVAVWGDSYWYYPATHVAIVVSDAGALLLCVSQNSSASQADNPYPGDSTGPTIIQHLPKEGLIGYLRIKTAAVVVQGEIVPEEDFMSQADVERIINELNEGNEAKHVATREHMTKTTDWAVLRLQSQIEVHHDLTRRYLKDVIGAAFEKVPGVDTQTILAAIDNLPKLDPAAVAEQVKEATKAALAGSELKATIILEGENHG